MKQRTTAKEYKKRIKGRTDNERLWKRNTRNDMKKSAEEK